MCMCFPAMMLIVRQHLQGTGRGKRMVVMTVVQPPLPRDPPLLSLFVGAFAFASFCGTSFCRTIGSNHHTDSGLSVVLHHPDPPQSPPIVYT